MYRFTGAGVLRSASPAHWHDRIIEPRWPNINAFLAFPIKANKKLTLHHAGLRAQQDNAVATVRARKGFRSANTSVHSEGNILRWCWSIQSFWKSGVSRGGA